MICSHYTSSCSPAALVYLARPVSILGLVLRDHCVVKLLPPQTLSSKTASKRSSGEVLTAGLVQRPSSTSMESILQIRKANHYAVGGEPHRTYHSDC